MFSSYSFVVLVELVVDLDGLRDEAEEVVVTKVAGGVVQHPSLAVVVAVAVGVATVVPAFIGKVRGDQGLYS